MTIAKTVLSTALVALLIGCSNNTDTTLAQTMPATKQAQKPVMITKADNGTTITVEQGQSVRIDLEGNISVGATWTVTATTGQAVKQDGKVTYASKPNNSGSPRVGAPGTFTVKFDATQPGSSKVSMEYKRPFDKGAPWETFSVTIKVVQAGSKKP